MLIPRACLVKTITCPLGVHIEVVFTLHVCSAFLEGLCSQWQYFDELLQNSRTNTKKFWQYNFTLRNQREN